MFGCSISAWGSGMTTLLTPLVAIVAVYIAWQQWRTAANKLKLDLFDRRFRVYRGLMDLLAAVEGEFNVPQDALAKYYIETDQKRFLFKSDLCDYMTEVRERVVKLRQLNRLIDPDAQTPEDKRNRAIEEASTIETWLGVQIEQASKKFEPYLGFRHNF